MKQPESLRQLFERALELPAGERHAFLRVHCPDPDLRARLQGMLDADDDGTDPLCGASPHTLADLMGPVAAPVGRHGERIGDWTLQEHLGDGGSASVFRATRDVEGTLQQAAIKLFHRNLHSPEAQHQFRRESVAMSVLDHPNIAQLIDGGVTDNGTPYLAITYINGLPITDHACAAQLTLRERLQLMVTVCRAVAAAHRHLIVHRDLKPANILVAADGTVKVLDFGIAKLLDASMAPLVDPTRSGVVPMTPAYAAPEQHKGGPISTATDVYALGVVLHELLLGERPSREQPTRPSVRVANLATDLWRLPTSRPALRAALRGDLDNILMKALAEEPERRYAGAAELADDLERYLSCQPVLAHPPSRWYRTRKFVQRHRGGVLVTLALALALVCTSAIAVWQAHQARQQARRANAQALRAHTVRNLLVDLFDAAIPAGLRDRLPDTAELLERGSERALRDLAGTPEVQIELLTALGRVYDHLNRPDQGEPLLDAAVAAARRLQPPDPALLGAALSERGEVEIARSNFAGAVALLDEALALQRQAGDDGVDLAVTLDRRAFAARNLGDHELAIALHLEANAIRKRRLPPESPEHLHSASVLGTTLMIAGRLDEAEPHLRRAAEGALAHFGDAHVKSAHYQKNLATLYSFRGDTANAVQSMRKAVEMERRLYPPGHPTPALGLNNLGTLELRLGQPQAALEHLEEARALNAGAGQDLTLGQSFVLGNLARALEILGDPEGATRHLDQAERAALASVPATHPRVLTLRLQRARLHFALAPDTAANLLAEADAVLAAVDSLGALRARSEPEARFARAAALAALDRPDEAAVALQAALASLPEPADPLLLPEIAVHAERLQQQGQHDQARTLLDTWLRKSAETVPADHFAIGRLHLAAAALATSPAERSTHADRAQAALRALPVHHPWRQRAAMIPASGAADGSRP